MRKFLFASSAIAALMIAAPAIAADMPVKYRPPPPPVPVFSWTGFYVGAHLGGAWGTTESTLTSVAFFDGKTTLPFGGFAIPISQTQTNGFLGGIQTGYNWQVNNWAVFGVEAQFSWTDLKGTSPCVLVLACSTDHDWITTVAGRFGVTYDRLLLYVKGGVAWTKATYSASLNLDGLITASTSVSDTRSRMDVRNRRRICLLGQLVGQDRVQLHGLPQQGLHLRTGTVRRRSSDQHSPWRHHPREGSLDQGWTQLPVRVGQGTGRRHGQVLIARESFAIPLC